MAGDGRPLKAYWSRREKDIVFSYPTKPDGQLLCNALHGIGVKELVAELDRRGYDITTLKFTIKQKEADNG